MKPRKSSQVQLTIVASLAAVATACGSSGTRCVDAQDRIVADSLCATVATADSTQRGRGLGGGGEARPYHPYMGGWWIWGLWGMGGRVFGGRPAQGVGMPAAGSQGSAARGGFGALGAAHGGGGGGAPGSMGS